MPDNAAIASIVATMTVTYRSVSGDMMVDPHMVTVVVASVMPGFAGSDSNHKQQARDDK